MGTHQNGNVYTTTATTATTITTTIGKDQSNDDDMRKSPDEAYLFPSPPYSSPLERANDASFHARDRLAIRLTMSHFSSDRFMHGNCQSVVAVREPL